MNTQTILIFTILCALNVFTLCDGHNLNVMEYNCGLKNCSTSEQCCGSNKVDAKCVPKTDTCCGDLDGTACYTGQTCCPSKYSYQKASCCGMTMSKCCHTQMGNSYCCGNNEPCCGGQCCASNVECCGETCCGYGQTCVNGICCQKDHVCSNSIGQKTCCPSSGMCCNKITPTCCQSKVCCNDKCCSLGEECAGGECCSRENVCGNSCCQFGEQCIGGQCCQSSDVCGSICCRYGTCTNGQCQ